MVNYIYRTLNPNQFYWMIIKLKAQVIAQI